MNYRFTKKTWIRVALVHLGVIFILVIPFEVVRFFKKKEVKFIEVVNLGSPKPGLGEPAPPQPAPKPKKKAKPTPKPKPKTKKKAQSKPKPKKKAKPKPKKKPKPKTKPKAKPKPQPKEKKIKVSRKLITRGDLTAVQPKPVPKVKSPSAGEIEKDLKQRLKKTIGVRAGDPAKSANVGKTGGRASWYHALIRETFLRHWKKPLLPGAAKLEAFITVRIAPDGTVFFLGLSQPSGNAAMDASVVQAARAVRKLSEPLPPGLGNPEYEVAVNFRLD